MTPSQMEPPLIRRSAKLNVEDLRVSKLNVRLEADPEGLDSLAESIKTVGLQHPLVVRQVPDEPDVYEVVEGSRRLRALKKLGHTTIECRIAEMDDQQALVSSIHENMWRGDITAAELSRAIKMMMEMMPEHWSEQKRRGRPKPRLDALQRQWKEAPESSESQGCDPYGRVPEYASGDRHQAENARRLEKIDARVVHGETGPRHRHESRGSPSA